jgi:MIP family channel proteins
MERTMNEKLIAEFIGTFALVFIGAGAIIHTQGPTDPAGLVAIALAHGLAIATMVSAVGHVSGAHFNPAITIGAWVTGKIQAGDAVGYISAQILGGVAAAGVLRVAIPETFWRSVGLGTPAVDQSISTGNAVLIEAVLTFFLVWVVFATAIDPHGAFGKIAGLAIGLVITMDILMGARWTGAAMNPARWFGTAAVAGIWTNWWVWIIGPIAGGIVAAVVYDSMVIRPHEEPVAPSVGEEVAHGLGAHGDEGEHDH